MSLYIDKTSEDPLPTTTEFLNQANDSSARKYTTTDSVENNSPTDSTSNLEHMVVAGAGAKSLSLSVMSLAAIARGDILQMEKSLLSATPDAMLPQRSNQGQFDESDVSTVQKGVATAAAAGFANVQNPVIRDMLVRRAQSFVVDSRLAVFPIRPEDAKIRLVNSVVPELESATVSLDRASAAVDCFSTMLLFNLPSTSTGVIKAIRIFRAEVDQPIFTRPLTTLSQAGMDRLLIYRGRKNQDILSVSQIRHTENGVPNSIQNLNPLDPYTNLRSSAGGDTALLVPPALAGQQPSAIADPSVPDALLHLDQSVIQNISILANIQNNPIFGFSSSTGSQPVAVGQNLNAGLQLGASQVAQVREFTSKSMFVIDEGNKLEFQEIAFLTTDKLRARRVQGRVEYAYKDYTVAYGKGYKYFIVTVDQNMLQSQRSSIATVVVEALRVPPRPSSVVPRTNQTSVALGITVDDQLIEKFEVHRLEFNPNRSTSVVASTIADLDGFSVNTRERKISSNNFLLLGECMNQPRGGAQFVDMTISPGRFYSYRVYSVDIFGNKSESPAGTQVYVPDLEQQFVFLKKPSILVEVDAASKGMKITFSCDDLRVEKMQLERRDLTVGQSTFAIPTTPSRVQLGLPRGRLWSNRELGELLVTYPAQSDAYHWNGVFLNENPGDQQVFVDSTAQLDHIYQYRIYGEDRYGNTTPHAISPPLLVSRRPFINAPTGLSATLETDQSSSITGVSLSWDEANIDKSAEELIGDQLDLSASYVRTLYQVQRKRTDEDTWQSFSLTTGTSLVDPVATSGNMAPNFRPAFLDLNHAYQYRVQAVQTGAFLSNFTEPVQVFVGYNVAVPENFSLKTPATYLRPFYVMLNWDRQANSGIVDLWEIERAEVNNFAAARLNLKNPDDFGKLTYQPFRTVYSESSRFSGKTQDSMYSAPELLNTSIVSGENYFMDTQVDFGNSYFYRIRAVSPEGVQSGWTYKGMKITSAIFESKWIPTLTDAEKQQLSEEFRPMHIVRARRPAPKSSLDMVPNFSKPDSLRTEPRTQFVVQGGE